MKETICTAAGLVGAAAASIFGGWDAALGTLVILMAADYITGLISAGVFNASPKTESGALESRVSWKGLCKKAVILLFVLIAHRLDMAVGTDYIKDAVIIGFMMNELISVVENAGLMGIPLPKGLRKAIEILKSREEEISGN